MEERDYDSNIIHEISGHLRIETDITNSPQKESSSIKSHVLIQADNLFQAMSALAEFNRLDDKDLFELFIDKAYPSFVEKYPDFDQVSEEEADRMFQEHFGTMTDNFDTQFNLELSYKDPTQNKDIESKVSIVVSAPSYVLAAEVLQEIAKPEKVQEIIESNVLQYIS